MLDAGVAEDPQIDVWALMRYQEQLMHRLEVPLDPADRGGHQAPADGLADGLAAQFTQEYARRYGPSAASAFQAAEIFALRARARVPAATRAITGTAASAPGTEPGTAAGSPIRTVPVFWPDAGKRVATTVYDGGGFTDGGEITGPALVELPHTTIAVPRAASLTADRGHFRLLLPAPETAERGTAR
jgi:N-methylhydantoinase A